MPAVFKLKQQQLFTVSVIFLPHTKNTTQHWNCGNKTVFLTLSFIYVENSLLSLSIL